MNFNDATREVFPGTHTLRNGYAVCNEAPGWGVDFDEAKAKKYPLHSPIDSVRPEVCLVAS